MANGSIESEFKFVSYKIDSVRFQMEKSIGLLLFNGNIDPADIEFQVAIHSPFYFKPKQIYICGLSCRVFFNQAKVNKDKVTKTVASTSEKEKADKETTPIFKLSTSIDGAFQTKSKTRFPSDLEETLVKIQAPTILYPFLRSSIVSFFANAGFGSLILPLVNINKVAELQKESLEIKEIE